VVLEIDTPGHTASIAESHPDLIACFERSPWKKYAHQPPPGQLRFASSSATDFTKAVFGSTLDLISSQYFGTGGDEINEKCMVCLVASSVHGMETDQVA
jgi:hexosaminidase